MLWEVEGNHLYLQKARGIGQGVREVRRKAGKMNLVKYIRSVKGHICYCFHFLTLFFLRYRLALYCFVCHDGNECNVGGTIGKHEQPNFFFNTYSKVFPTRV